MLDDEIANNIVKRSIRAIGGLGTSVPIEMQDSLSDVLIKTENQLALLRDRIPEEVRDVGAPAASPRFRLDVGFLRDIDGDSTVSEVAEIVASESERIA